MKIAFCFLTYNNIIRDDIWNNFFQNSNKEKYEVFIHPKNIVSNNYKFKYKIIDYIIDTKNKYDISIVNATINLLKYAYNYDNNISHFVFLSQSCIPLYNFNILYNIIINFPCSVISSINYNKKERYYKLSNFIKKFIKYENFVKQQPNMILINSDIQLLIKYNLIDHFKYVESPDEHYFINVLVNIFKCKIIKNQINFCNYDLNKTQALEFNNIDLNTINYIKNLGFLFMRKINKNTIINNNIFN